MSDTDSDVEMMNSDAEEQVTAPPPTVPKPTKKKKKTKKSKSDAKAAEKARTKRRKELEANDLSANDSDNDSKTKQEDDVSEVVSKMLIRMDNLELKNTQLQKEIDELKALNKNIAQVYSGKKPTKKNKPKKERDLASMTHTQVQSLVTSNWGSWDEPEDVKERQKLKFQKPKLPNEIANKQLREFIEDVVSNEDLLEEYEVELNDGMITTHNVTKIIKNHCKENDGLKTVEVIKDNGGTRDEKRYNLTEGDFEDMFAECPSSD